VVAEGESRGGAAAEPSAPDDETVFIEPRWPIALTLASFIAITIVLRIVEPERETLGPDWLVPSIEIGLLFALIAANPAHLVGRARWLRPLAITLIGLLAVVAMVANVILITDLVKGSKVTQSATSLLASGAIIWLGNALIFGLLYWELDSGGPLARYRRDRAHPDFAFSQQLNPELAPEGWRPVYVDYLILGITTSTAFSPTDVMPMSPWAKLMMAVQSLVSLTVIGLVIARAVNAFT
jgi:uncharacterized membrane protein